MKSSPRRFVLLTLGLVGLLCGGIAFFNFWVDPYNRFGNNRLGVYISAERETKATDVCRYPHNALLLGNSRMGMIQPGQLEGFRFFNAAFGGGTPEEAYYFLDHFARSQELVILGVDLGQCDPPSPQGDIFAPAGWKSALDNILNIKTVEYSARTISDHLAGKPSSIRRDGSFDTAGWFKLYDRENPSYLQWQLDGQKQGCDRFVCPTRERMSFLAKIAELLRQRGISCVVVIPPMHEVVAEHLRRSPVATAYAEWRRELDSIFPVVVDLSLGSYCVADNFFKSDAVHFKPDVGARMLNQEVIPVAVKVVKAQPPKRPQP